MARDVSIVKEDVVPNDIQKKQMTTDCHFVYLSDGKIDIVRGQTMVKIFDYYHDKGKTITKIEVSGGQLNPKLCEPFPDKDK